MQLAAFSVVLAGVGITRSAQAADGDGDGVADLIDNCVNAANRDQRDTNGDGFGNLCDADINNDGIVNSVDLDLIRRAFDTKNADADLNGDGVVNQTDLSLATAMSGKPPGPSNVRLSPTLAADPPVASRADLFTIDRVQPDGSNAAAFYSFRDQRLGSVVAMVFNRAVPFNDAGIEPDQKAGDGIYSAFVKLDVQKIQSDERTYLSRLPVGTSPQVRSFSGRDLTAQRPFVVPPPSQSSPIKTPSGVTLTPIPLRFGSIRPLAPTSNPTKSLTVTDLSVTTDTTRTFDPCDVDGDGNFGNVNGVWSFKTLMTNMANTGLTGITAQQFVHNWLRSWMAAQTVNSFTIMPRPTIQSFFPGWDGVNAATLNMNKLPFRLLAIVNRMDLAGASLYGSPPDAKKSETRLVFGLVDQSSASCKVVGNTGAARRMTVIFEYGDPTTTCTDLQTRAQAWIALTGLPFPSAAYNTALQALTDAVTVVNAAPTKPNGSALDQLRTNEIALAGPWQLREFGLTAPFSNLLEATIKQTPDPGLFRFGSPVTKQFLETNADAILCETHVVPDIFLGNPFLGSHADYGFGTFWDAPTVIAGVFPSCWTSNVSSMTLPTKKGEVRHKFSLNTCDDCHSGETNTVFTHVDPMTSPAALSGFLTGVTVNDPGGEPVQRTFNDLARRAQALEDAALGCHKLPGSFFAESVMKIRNSH